MTNNAIKTLRQLRLLRGLQNQDTVVAMPNFMVSKENVQMYVRVLLVAKKAGPWLGLVLQVRILIIIFFNVIWYALHTAHVMRWYLHPRHLTEFPYLELRSISVPHRREKCEQWLKCPLLILFSLLRLRNWMKKNFLPRGNILQLLVSSPDAPVEKFPLFCVSPQNKGLDMRFYAGPTTLKTRFSG